MTLRALSRAREEVGNLSGLRRQMRYEKREAEWSI
jgi:hypothetical protein